MKDDRLSMLLKAIALGMFVSCAIHFSWDVNRIADALEQQTPCQHNAVVVQTGAMVDVEPPTSP